MAEIAQDSKGHGGKGKPKKLSTRVDFTPMVDLGFLLITFFMLATTLSKPNTMALALPSKEKVDQKDQSQVKASRAVSIILDKDNTVYYYEGTRDPKTGQDPVLKKTDFSPSGIRKFLLARNFDIVKKIQDLKDKKREKKISPENFEKQRTELMADKSAPIVRIMGTDAASYGSLVNILDEMDICSIGRYAVVDMNDYDKELLKKANS